MSFLAAHAEAITVALLGGLAAAGSATVSAALARRAINRTADAALLTGEAVAQGKVNEGFVALLDGFKQTQADANEKIEVLTGEVRELTQHIISLENILRDNGLPIPQRRFMAHRLSVVAPPSSGN